MNAYQKLLEEIASAAPEAKKVIAPVESLAKLPTTFDGQSVSLILAAVVSLVVSVLGIFHPGFREPSWAEALLGPAGVIGSVGAIVANVVTHRGAHKAVAVALAHAAAVVAQPVTPLPAPAAGGPVVATPPVATEPAPSAAPTVFPIAYPSGATVATGTPAAVPTPGTAVESATAPTVPDVAGGDVATTPASTPVASTAPVAAPAPPS